MNKKSFNLYRKISSSFNFIISGFSVVSSWVMILRIKLRLSPVVSLIGKMLVTNKEKLRLVISSPLLAYKVLSTVKGGKTPLTFISRLRARLVQTFTILDNIVLNMKLRIRLQFTNNIHRIKLVADASVETFRKLLEFDPEILGDLDVLTLGDMDKV